MDDRSLFLSMRRRLIAEIGIYIGNVSPTLPFRTPRQLKMDRTSLRRKLLLEPREALVRRELNVGLDMTVLVLRTLFPCCDTSIMRLLTKSMQIVLLIDRETPPPTLRDRLGHWDRLDYLSQCPDPGLLYQSSYP